MHIQVLLQQAKQYFNKNWFWYTKKLQKTVHPAGRQWYLKQKSGLGFYLENVFEIKRSIFNFSRLEPTITKRTFIVNLKKKKKTYRYRG